MLKKYLKLINILLTAAVSLLLWKTVGISRHMFRTQSLYNAKETKKISDKTFLNSEPESPETDFKKKNIFGFRTAKSSNPEHYFFNYKLRGTIVSDGYISLVILENLDTGKQNIYTINDIIAENQIIAIERKFIILQRPSGDKTYLRLDKKGPEKTPPEKRTVEKIAPNQWMIKEEIINDSLKDINTFLKQVRIIPYFKNGSSAGFMFTNINKESFLNKIGFKNGDILKAIDGTAIDNPYAAVKALKSLIANSKKDISLVIERGNQSLTFFYKIH